MRRLSKSHLWRKPARWDQQLEDAVAVTKAVEDAVLVLTTTRQFGACKPGVQIAVARVPLRKKALLQWARRESDHQVERGVVVEVEERRHEPSTLT